MYIVYICVLKPLIPWSEWRMDTTTLLQYVALYFMGNSSDRQFL